MVDPAVLEAERQQIFDRVWLYLGHESEVPAPGDYLSRTIGERALILCRDESGTVRVLLNSCTHRGATDCREAHGHRRFLKCFYHAWTFDLSGSLVALPDDEAYGPGFDRASLAWSAPPRVETYRGFVFVAFNRAVEELTDYLGNAREYIDLVCDQAETRMEILPGTQEYSIKANWKLLVENSIDGYHAMPTHATYMDYLLGAMRRGAEAAGEKMSTPSLTGGGKDPEKWSRVHRIYGTLGAPGGQMGAPSRPCAEAADRSPQGSASGTLWRGEGPAYVRDQSQSVDLP
jgi:phenylpropionate dioxygenase-like ring-hydroxylating dioxygenase large terminal subunit